MTRFRVFAALAGVALSGCGKFGKSEAYKTYMKFTAAKRNGNCDEMRKFVAEEAAEFVESLCRGGSGSAASMMGDMSAAPAAAMRKTKRSVESETGRDGAVELKVLIKTLGRKSNFGGGPPPPRRETVTARKIDGAWKLTSYASERVH